MVRSRGDEKLWRAILAILAAAASPSSCSSRTFGDDADAGSTDSGGSAGDDDTSATSETGSLGDTSTGSSGATSTGGDDTSTAPEGTTGGSSTSDDDDPATDDDTGVDDRGSSTSSTSGDDPTTGDDEMDTEDSWTTTGGDLPDDGDFECFDPYPDYRGVLPKCVGFEITAPPKNELEEFCVRPSECHHLALHTICFMPPEGKNCEDHGWDESCIRAEYWSGVCGGNGKITCGPITTLDGACCYGVAGVFCLGRPYRVQGAALLAETRQEAHEAAPHPGRGPSEPALLRYWILEAQAEHASVASFSRFALQLTQLGAPLALLAACARAVADEARHAELCLEFASALGSPPLRFGPLDVGAGLGPEAFNPLQIATSLAAEGCIAETIAARLAEAAAEAARGTALEPDLRSIASDEAEHAALAWRALAWLLSEGHEGVRDAVSLVFLSAGQYVGIGSLLPPGEFDTALCHRHGILSNEERRSLAVTTLEAVVLPAASVLLGWSGTTTARAHGAADGILRAG